MLITESTFKQGYLYKIVFSGYFNYSVVINLNNTEVTLTDISATELDINQDYDDAFWNMSYGDNDYVMNVIEIGPVLTYGEQIKRNYPELLI